MLKLLDNCGIEYEKYKYNEFINYLEDNVEINIEKPERNKSNTQKSYITMTVKNFKRAMMMVNTERGKQVREYYLQLEDLLYEYMEFQVYYEKHMFSIVKSQNNQLLIELNNIKSQNNEILGELNELKDHTINIENKLDKSIEERSVKTNNKSLWHKLIIIDLNNINEGNYKDLNYYTIRAQKRSANKEYIKRFNGVPKIYETVYYEGNPINLYNKIKEEFKDKAFFNKNSIKLKQNINHKQFSGELIDFCDNIKEEFNEE